MNAAAILLGSEGNVPEGRTAMLMSALLGAPVSAGFVARAPERLAAPLAAAGFDAAMKAALRAGEVLCAGQALRKASAAVTAAIADGKAALDPDLLAGLRERYDDAIGWGQTTNRLRDWHDGNHPGYAVSGYWHTLATLTRYCRVRSYLLSSRGHGIAPINAIHAALAGRPWIPSPVSA